ncbi:MAG: hypothetical protein IJY20_00290 [Clostridia bacterium]|nr:hypothetical protein [Clostridia bacterium]
MVNFWDSNVWETFLLFTILFAGLLVGNVLKKGIPLLRTSLIPTSVLGGVVILIVEALYKAIAGGSFFSEKANSALEIITYHALALGFIASTLKTSKSKLTKQRTVEIFNTGVTTVATYLLQGIFGLVITIVASLVMTDFFAAAGVLLPFGYGQGTGQALNYGNIYEVDYGFSGGKSFGLTIAALGFLSASFGGVIHLNIMKQRGKLPQRADDQETIRSEDIQAENEIPMQESVDKLTIQVALIAVTYMLAYGLMLLLGHLLPGMRSTIFGFNFLLGVLCATGIKVVIRLLKRIHLIKKDYTNNFLLTRTSNFFFDIMVVSGIAAIRLDILERYWGIMLILGAVGLVITYIYNRIVAKLLFKDYTEEQFLAMYGMLTGTASTGIILLREVDGNFDTPAADNLVYQNFPAIAFGFPMLLLATLAPKQPYLTLGIFVAFFAVMNILLFRSLIFKRKSRK